MFAGFDLGIVEEMVTFPEPKARQVNTYPAVNGLELLDMGSRGLHTAARGALAGFDPTDLAAIKQALGALVLDGGAYPLLDADGTLWPGVILVAFRPVGRRYRLAGDAGVAQRYEAEFLHNA